MNKLFFRFRVVSVCAQNTAASGLACVKPLILTYFPRAIFVSCSLVPMPLSLPGRTAFCLASQPENCARAEPAMVRDLGTSGVPAALVVVESQHITQ